MIEEEGFMDYSAAHHQGAIETFWQHFLGALWLSISVTESVCRIHEDKTDKPFGQEVQKVQVLLALLEVPEKYKQTIIQGSHC